MSDKKLWNFPWRFRESFLIAFGVLLVGFIIELFARVPVSLQWPNNLLIGLVILALVILLQGFYKNHAWVRWLTTVPAAVSAVSLFALMVLFIGFLKPGQLSFLFNHNPIQHSWIFAFSAFYLLLTLGSVTIRRLKPFNLKNAGFFLNHAGLWIIILGGGLGAGDMERYIMHTFEDKGFTHMVFDEREESYKVPFEIRLLDFSIEHYNLDLIMINRSTGELTYKTDKNAGVKEGAVFDLKGWQISIDKYLSEARKLNGQYVQTDSAGATPAAYLVAKRKVNGKTVSGWVASGSFNRPADYVNLNRNFVLTLSMPEAKKYASEVVVRQANNTQADTSVITVNNPLKVQGWKIYQLSYDEQKGKWSKLSILEVIRDPWLPVVYTGIFMLLAGAVYLFWMGVKSKR